MQMPDDVVLREAGRFTFEFNAPDNVITQLAVGSIECAELQVAEYLTSKMALGQKLARIRAVSGKLATVYGLDRERLLTQIASANALIEHRNTLLQTVG